MRDEGIKNQFRHRITNRAKIKKKHANLVES